MAKLPKGLKGKTVNGAIQAVGSEELQKQVAKEMSLEDLADQKPLDQIIEEIKAHSCTEICSECASDIFPPGSTKHECNEDTEEHDETGSN